MRKMIILILMTLCILWVVIGNFQKEEWDFDDFPELCRRKIKKTEEALAFANTPHFGGTPNNSQVWM